MLSLRPERHPEHLLWSPKMAFLGSQFRLSFVWTHPTYKYETLLKPLLQMVA